MDETRPDLPEQNTEPQEYEPPRVENLPTDAPAVTAAGEQKDDDLPPGPEWRS